MMEAETVSETFVDTSVLTWLITREEFIPFICRKNYNFFFLFFTYSDCIEIVALFQDVFAVMNFSVENTVYIVCECQPCASVWNTLCRLDSVQDVGNH
jgi:hypothetical protein